MSRHSVTCAVVKRAKIDDCCSLCRHFGKVKLCYYIRVFQVNWCGFLFSHYIFSCFVFGYSFGELFNRICCF